MATSKTGTQTDASQSPFMDFGKMMEQFKLPGVDINAIVEAQRRDIEALTQANKQAYEGMQGLAQRQAEMLQGAMGEWQAAMQDMAGKDPVPNTAKQTDLARQAFEKALANMRELAEMAARSQSDAWQVVQKRFQENLAEFRKALQPK